jgi:GR25 family glycosyltransferase involved in LPS biosynthesis
MKPMYMVYINLDRRIDRRQEFEAEATKLGIQVERFPAIEREPGGIGCTASHLELIKRAKREGLPEILVFEDDFQCLVSKEQFEDILESMPSDYDVVMISYNLIKSEPYNEKFGRALEVQTTAGYIVHSKFYDTLIQTWEEGLKNYEANPYCHWLYIIDQSWKPLQLTHKFYYTIPRLGKQRAGYSDLANRFVDYNN